MVLSHRTIGFLGSTIAHGAALAMAIWIGRFTSIDVDSDFGGIVLDATTAAAADEPTPNDETVVDQVTPAFDGRPARSETTTRHKPARLGRRERPVRETGAASTILQRTAHASESHDPDLTPPKSRNRRDTADELPTIVEAARSPTVTTTALDPGSSMDRLPRPVNANPGPTYPVDAWQRGEQGRVIVEVGIDEFGRVESVRVAESSGSRSLDESALQTVRRWRFHAGRKLGLPAAVTVRVPIDFVIRQRGS